MFKNCQFDFIISECGESSYDFVLETEDNLDVQIEGDISNSALIGAYDGSYNITPSQNEQLLNTKNKMLTENIIVSAIPSNYGLITWNGSTLTVS